MSKEDFGGVMKVIFFATLVAFLSYLCYACAATPEKCIKECISPDSLVLVSAYKGKFGEQIFISDCGNDYRINFYRIELRNFHPNESVVLRAVPHVIESATTLRTDRHGYLIFTIVPTHPQRKEHVLDFDFWRPRNLISLGVNKVRKKSEPEMPRARDCK